jgi:hypothetical protein
MQYGLVDDILNPHTESSNGLVTATAQDVKTQDSHPRPL